MSYAIIDPVLQKWAKGNNFKIFTHDRDWEVRSIHIDGTVKRGRNYRIWIDEPSSPDRISVHFMNLHSPKVHSTSTTSLAELEQLLSDLLARALGH